MKELKLSNAHINTFTSNNEVEDHTNMEFEDGTQQDNSDLPGRKRTRDDNSSSEEGWNVVTRRRNKVSRSQNELNAKERIQVCVTSKNPLPKQFALARLFKTNNISGDNISRLKYVHQYKILVTFDNETEADEFLRCKAVTDLNWRCQKTSKVGICYGLIKSVELDITDEEFMANVSSSADIIHFRRLNKRCPENIDGNGWTPSETIRLGFKGSSLPSYVYIFGLRVPVERFIFPVTQCAKCWKYGHPTKLCPFKKVVCPKCGQNHENCTTTSFTCINCTGDHMAFDKVCPIFKKEKKIRELMAYSNCTYRKALSMYVPPTPKNKIQQVSEAERNIGQKSIVNVPNIEPTPLSREANNCTDPRMETLDSASRHSLLSKPLPKRTVQKKNRRPPTSVNDTNWLVDNESSDCNEDHRTTNVDNTSKSDKYSHNLTFWHLFKTITDIIKNKESLQTKIQQSLSVFAEWLTQKIVSSLSIEALFEKFVRNG